MNRAVKKGAAVAGALIVMATASVADARPVSQAPATSPTAAAPPTYLILANGNELPDDLVDQVTAAGGALAEVLPRIGVAMASSANPDFAAAVAATPGIRSVSRSPQTQRLFPTRVEDAYWTEGYGNPPVPGGIDPFIELQWGLDAVDAPEAWAEGRLGAGARVAVLDDGFDLDHPDLAPNIAPADDLGAPRSFVVGEGAQWTGDIFSHGTHAAGTVAAADNGFGVIGVAPDATLLLGKVLPESGCGGDGPILAGIVWAGGEADADVISLGLGVSMSTTGYVDPGCSPGPEDDVALSAGEVAEIRLAYDRAVRYARGNGATVIASAGTTGLDVDGTEAVIHLPSDAAGVVSVSATGPLTWATDRATNLDLPANAGGPAIDFSAPGGNLDLEIPGLCTVAGITRACPVFDMVFSTGSNGWYWSAGTSMAAPHAAGVAALIVGANGGERTPTRVEAALRELADPLDANPFYGRGAIDATNSVDDD